MIHCLVIDDVATFVSVAALSDLKGINYLFGSNGSGKTTISRVLKKASLYPKCSVTWQPLTTLECLVYNCDFRDENFAVSSPLRGVFTLGEESVLLQKQIASKQEEVERVTDDIAKLTRTLCGDGVTDGKQKELETLQEDFAETCWKQKVKHNDKFTEAFVGRRDSKAAFRDRLLQESTSNTAALLSLEEMTTAADTVFGPSPTKEPDVKALVFAQLQALESSAVLAKAVVGRGDVDIASLIKAVGNADWVGAGRQHFDKSDPQCPFCQQPTPDDLRAKLDAFFDTTYQTDCDSIAQVLTGYEVGSASLKADVQALIDGGLPRLDVELLGAHQQALDAVIAENVEHLKAKKREPSTRTILTSIKDACEAFNAIVATANLAIAKHNAMVSNLPQEKKKLTEQVWRYLLDTELKTELATYEARRAGLNGAIQGLQAKIQTKRTELATLEHELRELERQTTSVKPTMDAINLLLASFGFTTFKLRESASAGAYELIRADGTLVSSSLSDGERTFLTFLYFYHLISGSDTSSGTKAARVIVFDDPISSLDSDVLFVVSNLIKQVFALARDPSSHVKQVFVLTHNVYFHKEITFDSQRQGSHPRSDESFWVVRRKGIASTIERCATNPVKSSYDLLWTEVRNPNPSSATICNALRRILENYFKLLGGGDLNRLYESFEGEEKTICRSLVSWINDGSHFAMEDLHLSQTEDVIPKYLDVFRKVFETQGHEAHYKMMMGNAYVERPANAN